MHLILIGGKRWKDEEIENCLAPSKDARLRRNLISVYFAGNSIISSKTTTTQSSSSSGQLPLAPLIGPPPTSIERSQRQWAPMEQKRKSIRLWNVNCIVREGEERKRMISEGKNDKPQRVPGTKGVSGGSSESFHKRKQRSKKEKKRRKRRWTDIEGRLCHFN